ncbi:MAG: insulinase family protein, partial [Desulfuromonadales bacterium]|nr:insulinase family protein [Desulfuromonadales bacterium]
THSVVSRNLRLDFYAYPERYLETYREKIAAVTVADVQRVAQQYLRPEQLQIVLVGTSADFAKDVEAFGLPLERVPLKVH